MRLVSSPHIQCTYREVCEYWDIDEVIAAHEVIDIREELEQESTQS